MENTAAKSKLIQVTAYLLYALLLSLPSSVGAEGAGSTRTSELRRAAAMRGFFGITDAHLQAADFSDVRVAVLSKGLGGLEKKGVKYLPNSAQAVAFYEGTDSVGPENSDRTGLRVAQIVWGLTGFSESGPIFRVYNANGLKNLKLAVDAARAWKADILVNTQSFGTFGNFDGTGPIHKLVEEATRDGILWVQAVSEKRGAVVDRPIKTFEAEGVTWVRLTDKGPVLFKVNWDDTPIEITASWNGFAAGKGASGTDKDLDLILVESNKAGRSSGNTVAVSAKRQVVRGSETESERPFAFERISTRLGLTPGYYGIWLKDSSRNFDSREDWVKLQVSSSKKTFFDSELKKEIPPFEFVNVSANGSSVLIPDDSPSALSVGDLSPTSAVGPTRDGRIKPDLILDRAEAIFSDNEGLSGPVVAAAQVASFAALQRGIAPSAGRAEFLRWVEEMKARFDLEGFFVSQDAKQKSFLQDNNYVDFRFFSETDQLKAFQELVKNTYPSLGVFLPYFETGEILAHSRRRFLARDEHEHVFWVARDPVRLPAAKSLGPEPEDGKIYRYFLFFRAPQTQGEQPAVRVVRLQDGEKLPAYLWHGPDTYYVVEFRELPGYASPISNAADKRDYSRRWQMPSVAEIRKLVSDKR